MDIILALKILIVIIQIVLIYVQIKYKKPELCAVVAALCLLCASI